MTTSDTPDWAEQKAAELLPCEYGRQSPTSSRPQLCYEGHAGACRATYRPAVAEALRAAKQAGLEEAAKVADKWETTLTAEVSCSNGVVPVALVTDGREVGRLIRALKEQP